MSSYPHLFSPIRVGSAELPSRLVMGSMHTGLEGTEGSMPRLAAFYAERARGGVPLIVTGGWAPVPEGQVTPHPGVFDNETVAREHRVITEAVHKEGARILLQILHPGRYAATPKLVAPSPIRAPINPFTPRELEPGEIEETIAAFARTTRLALEAGYDGVEVMGSEGYLITQFLAPRTNKRTDEWGGSLQNRARFAIETVKAVRAALGDKILMYRISALDLVDDALGADEIAWVAGEVEAAGADVLDTGIGWHEARIPTIAQTVPRAAFTFALKGIKEAVSIPVIATNRINTPEIAEDILARGEADMIALARPFLADENFAAKARDGAPERINTCIACNQACLDHLFSGAVATCLVNPRACFETEIVIEPAPKAKRIAVIGAGPAGLAAATVAAERGHKVTLFEAADRIGGQLNLARVVPGKSEFDETLRYFRVRLEETGVDVRLGTRADAEALEDFDEVILAAGVLPRQGIIEGEDHPSVASYVDILSGARAAGGSVAVVGAGGIGFDVTVFLIDEEGTVQTDPEEFRRHWGIGVERAGGHAARQVTMLQRTPGAMGKRLGKTTGWVHRIEIKEAGVEQISGVAYSHIDDDGLHIVAEGAPRTIKADTIVLCAGQEERTELADALAAAGVRVHIIGGARLAAELDAKRAIDDGVRLAAAL